jgi:lysophospholipase L1-like esterase
MRFVAFGCSHTWGDGILPGDSWNTPPSSASWVQVLSNKFNIPVLNLAKSGGSNLLILHAIRNHDWQVGDIALIQWTYFERDTIFDNKTAYRDISSFRICITDEEFAYTKQYYTLFPNYHIEYMNLQYIEHAYLYLAAHNIPKVARFADNVTSIQLSEFNNNMLADFQKPSLDYIVETFEKKHKERQTGADNMHYNELMHQVFAEEYVSEITNLL